MNLKSMQIYNTLTKKKEYINQSSVIIYSCGVTVYDYCHIGHARIFIFFDSLIRYLNFKGISVIYIRNITDIDDKIIYKSFKFKSSIKVVSDYFVDKMHDDTKCLSLFEPTFEPKATNFVKSVINLISFLKNEKFAYIGIDKDIYYDVYNNSCYGILSKVILANAKVGSKNLRLLNKKVDLDFTLWKSDDAFWQSPWGFGRPGWHSECSAMNLYYSDTKIDIHSGGKDLLFPHHENELAQIYPVKGLDFIRTWMHIGHVKIFGEKMSKSLNNYFLIKDFLKKYNEEYLRFFLLFTHYSKEIDYSENKFKKTIKILNNLYKILLNHKCGCTFIVEVKNKFINFLDSDFNTSAALTVLFDLVKQIKSYKNLLCEKSQMEIFTLKYLGNTLGLLKYSPKFFLYEFSKVKKKNIIKELIKKREIARGQKKWELADKLRLKLCKLGVIINDKKIE
jgi:cysteinyl-tRNA synthetase